MLSLLPGAPLLGTIVLGKCFTVIMEISLLDSAEKIPEICFSLATVAKLGCGSICLSQERETASIGIKDSIFLSKLDQLSINLRYRECLILALSHKKH